MRRAYDGAADGEEDQFGGRVVGEVVHQGHARRNAGGYRITDEQCARLVGVAPIRDVGYPRAVRVLAARGFEFVDRQGASEHPLVRGGEAVVAAAVEDEQLGDVGHVETRR